MLIKSIESYSLISTSIKNDVVVNDYVRSLGEYELKYSFPGASSAIGLGLSENTLNFVTKIMYFVWPYFLMPVINVAILAKLLIFKLKLKGFTKKKFPSAVIFASGNTTLKVINKAIGVGPVILCRPGKRDHIDKSCDVLDSIQLLSLGELISIFFSAILLSFRFSYDSRFVSLRFYSMHFFELLAVAKVFDKFSSIEVLYTGDHFDRWATLLDMISADKKKVSKFCVIQHGALKNSNGVFPIDLEVKLKSVDFLYCFDEESYSIFSNSILDVEMAPPVSYFENKIELSKLDQFDGKSILVVGNSLCVDFHNELAKSICAVYGEQIRVYYKPHPTQERNNFSNEEWLIIRNSSFFPEVDLVVSYPSTLVEQYKAHAVPTVVHSLSARKQDIDNTLKDVLVGLG